MGYYSDLMGFYPLVNIQKAIENDDFPIENGDLMGF